MRTGKGAAKEMKTCDDRYQLLTLVGGNRGVSLGLMPWGGLRSKARDAATPGIARPLLALAQPEEMGKHPHQLCFDVLQFFPDLPVLMYIVSNYI